MKKLIEAIKKIATENENGFTVYFPSLEPVKSGWVVAVADTQNSFGDNGLVSVIEYLNDSTCVLGAWNDNGTWYWDACQLFTDEAEATEAGIQNEQIAIYHIETNTVKYL